DKCGPNWFSICSGGTGTVAMAANVFKDENFPRPRHPADLHRNRNSHRPASASALAQSRTRDLISDGLARARTAPDGTVGKSTDNVQSRPGRFHSGSPIRVQWQ